MDITDLMKHNTLDGLNHEKINPPDGRWFWFLIVYWLLSLAMIPVLGCTSDRKYDAVRSIYGILSLAAFALFLLVPSLRHQMEAAVRRMFSKSTYRELSTKRKWIFGLLCLLLAALFGITAYCMHRFDAAGGFPFIYEGRYCIWNHRFIREILLEEYRSLCLLENLQSTCGRAAFPTGLLLLQCFTEKQ